MLRIGILLALFPLIFSGLLGAQAPIRGQDIEKVIKRDEKPIAIRSSNPDWVALAELAFSTHGGYRLVEGAQPAFTFMIEPSGVNKAFLSIESGQPARELFSQTVSGSSDRNALLRACDLAVRKTLGIPGYFAGKLAFVANRTGDREIWTSDLFFQNARQLTGHRSQSVNPHWSPDGKKLLYTSYYRSGFPDLMLMDMATQRPSVFASYKGTNAGGAFSPNGGRVALILSATGNSELYVAPASGKNPKRLTRTRGVEASPAWSPDSKEIVYTSDELGGPQLFIISASGGKPRYINTRLSRYIDEPDWNPLDADEILFTAAAGGGYQIGLVNLATRKANWLTQTGTHSEACWLNDGRHLVYVSKRGTWHGLRILDTISGKETALHSSKFGNAWQPDFVYPK